MIRRPPGPGAAQLLEGPPREGHPDSLQPLPRNSLHAFASSVIQRFRDELIQRGLLATRAPHTRR